MGVVAIEVQWNRNQNVFDLTCLYENEKLSDKFLYAVFPNPSADEQASYNALRQKMSSEQWAIALKDLFDDKLKLRQMAMVLQKQVTSAR